MIKMLENKCSKLAIDYDKEADKLDKLLKK